MKEIKFRAWRKENGEWIEYNQLNLDTKENNGDLDIRFVKKGTNEMFKFNIPFEHPKYFIIEQFTGLKDKNGKDIYEGDIVRVGQLEWLREVIWYHNGFKLRAIPEKTVQQYLKGYPNKELEDSFIEEISWEQNDEIHYDLLDSKVIGNIHEYKGE